MTDSVTPQGRQAMRSALSAVTASMLDGRCQDSYGHTSVPQLALEVSSLIAIVRLLVDELAREKGWTPERVWSEFCMTSAITLEGD